MTAESTANRSPITILLVDDEPGVLLALRLLMQAVGYKVREYSNPNEAIEFLKGSEPCDVVICDLKMPKVDGIGVLKETKKLRPTLPFVLMSGHAQAPEIDKASELGSAGFLGKPFSPAQLKAIIDEVVPSS